MISIAPDEAAEVNSSESQWHDNFHDRDVVIVSPQYWSDIWVSKHWIAHQLSRHNRVLFVDPAIWMATLIKRPREDVSNWKRAIWPLRKIDQQLHVLTPRIWPGFLRGATAGGQLARSAQALGFKKPVVINFTTNTEITSQLDAALKVYYCVDPAPEDLLRNICNHSDLIYGVSDIYHRQFSTFGCSAPIHMIPHGFAVQQAQAALTDDKHSRPKEFQGLRGPICGFVGSVCDSYVDVGRLEMLSQQRPDYSFVLIGPYKDSPLGPAMSSASLARIRRLPNVHLLGPRPFQSLPGYTKFFDACLVLLDVNGHNTKQRTLFKWLLYLSQGKPVVSPWIKEAETVADMAYLARTEDEYLSFLDQAVNEPADAAIRRQRLEYAKQFSFEKVLTRLVRPISEHLSAAVRS